MDVLQRVRDLRNDVDVRDGAVSDARAALSDAIREERSRSSRRRLGRPVVLFAGAAAAVAAVTVGVLVLPGMLTSPEPQIADPVGTPSPNVSVVPVEPSATPSAPPAQPPTAQVVFASVAQRVLMGEAPSPSPGQYLRIDSVEETLISYNSLDGVNDLAVSRSNAETAWVVSRTQTSYAPADIHGEWVLRFPGALAAVAHFGAGAEARASEWLQTLTPMDPEFRVEGGPGPTGGWADGQGGQLSDFLDRVPDEPNALRAWFDDVYGDGNTDPQKTGWTLAALLAQNVGSKEQRAAMYHVLSELPGAELVAQEDDRATIVFHTVPGHANDPQPDRWHSITIDTRTGVVLEYTDRIGSNPSLVPDSTPDERRTFTVSVVDEVP